MTKFKIEEDYAPILHVIMNETPDEISIPQMYTAVVTALNSGRFKAVLWDADQVNLATTTIMQRKVFSDTIKENIDSLRKHMLLSARVLNGKVVMGAVVAIDWIVGDYGYPIKNFLTHQEAEKWLLNSLEERNIPVLASSLKHNDRNILA